MWYQQKLGIESASMNDETLLYNPDSVKFCALSPTAAFLWERLAVPRTELELVADLVAAYQPDAAAGVPADVKALLEQLVAREFLTTTDQTPAPAAAAAPLAPAAARSFVTPRVHVMDESEVLAAFQVTSAGTSWWAV